VIASNDRAVSPELEKAEATAMEGYFDHGSLQPRANLSHPEEVADLIEQAAAKSEKPISPPQE